MTADCRWERSTPDKARRSGFVGGGRITVQHTGIQAPGTTLGESREKEEVGIKENSKYGKGKSNRSTRIIQARLN